MSDLQKELKFLRKTFFIDDASTKLKSSSKIEDQLSKLNQDVGILKESTSVQVIFFVHL